MNAAVESYSEHRNGSWSDLLGRFVVPVARLAEFADAAQSLLPRAGVMPWQLSAIAGPESASDRPLIDAFNFRRTGAKVAAVEAKAESPEQVAEIAASFPPDVEVWIELPATTEGRACLPEVARTGRGAKLRTGGVTAEAFPRAEAVVEFLIDCHALGVPAKATAGLHHPLTGVYPLTYEPGSPRAAMFGFVNLLLASTLIHSGGSATEAVDLLSDPEARHFGCSSEALTWKDRRFTRAQLSDTRDFLLRSFGSCSFNEPVEGLQTLGWL